ncbi:MAG: tetratricopeptide repeat protein [Gemmatimonadota bacterium]
MTVITARLQIATPPVRALALLGVAGALLGAPASPASAQRDLSGDLKPLPTPVSVCERLGPFGAGTATTADSDRAVALLGQADEAALLGEADRATDLLRRAAALDPAAPEVAYRLARGLEDASDPAGAVFEYCRFLALVSTGAQAEDAVERLATLAEATPPSVDGRGQAAFSLGLQRAGEGDIAGADAAFSNAVTLAPDWPEAWYNRSLVRAEAADTAGARADLRRYLELRPDADDLAPVELRLAALEAPPPPPVVQPSSPAVQRTGFAANAVFPGLGQFRSGRYGVGVLALAAAAGAVALGVMSERQTVSCIVLPVGGECPAGQVVGTATERPYLAAGIGAAALVSVLGALEQHLWSSGAGAGGPRLGLSVETEAGRIELGPAIGAGGEGVDLSFVRMRF